MLEGKVVSGGKSAFQSNNMTVRGVNFDSIICEDRLSCPLI